MFACLPLQFDLRVGRQVKTLVMKFHKAKTAEEIASIIKAQLKGKSSYSVTGINEIHMVQPGDITFVDHPKYYDKALNSAATFIIIDKIGRASCRERV